MKTLLVLYPIQPYTDGLMTGRESLEIKDEYARIYQVLIAERYPDFQIVWIMFSRPWSITDPDMSQLWKGISIKKSDIVAACGVSFEEHCGKNKYPDPKDIIKSCPQPIEKLIIGGFHFWDCVEKVAEYAFRQGIDVTVDDDLTEFFFHKIRDQKGNPSDSNIPFSRKKSVIKARRRFLESGGTLQLDRVRKAREKKPWLIKI